MSTALGVLATALLLFVAVWLAVFGGVGALLAARRGRSRTSGFLWGAVLGPIGWIVLLFRPGTRIRTPERVDEEPSSIDSIAVVSGDDELPIH